MPVKQLTPAEALEQFMKFALMAKMLRAVMNLYTADAELNNGSIFKFGVAFAWAIDTGEKCKCGHPRLKFLPGFVMPPGCVMPYITEIVSNRDPRLMTVAELRLLIDHFRNTMWKSMGPLIQKDPLLNPHGQTFECETNIRTSFEPGDDFRTVYHWSMFPTPFQKKAGIAADNQLGRERFGMTGTWNVLFILKKK